MKTIALVEDDLILLENYRELLRHEGYKVDAYSNSESALRRFQQWLPDMAILDIGLKNDPEGGYNLCRELRSLSKTLPIIFLTARDSDIDVVSGLRLGADDYLTKDISLHQLIARIAALFRRTDALKSASTSTALHIGDLSIDIDRLQISWQQSPLTITVTEFWIVYSLVKHPGHVKNRDQLMDDAKLYVDSATITTHIKRIRSKFQKIDPTFDAIESVYGTGYRWVI